MDLAFVNLETATLRRAVGTVLTIDDDGAARRIFTPSGEPVAEVLRRADGTIQFRNLLHGYSYTLKQVDG